MLDLIGQLADQERVPACCIDRTGLIRYANDAAFALSPLCTTMFLTEFLPEFFPFGDYQPDYPHFSSQQTLFDWEGRRLELCRFGDWFLCRLQPPAVQNDAPPSGSAGEIQRIRRAASDLLNDHSENEDRVYLLHQQLSDHLEQTVKESEKAETMDACRELGDTVRAGTLSARQIILGCNRLEISYLSDFSLYPPQRVELCDALQKLVSDIKNAVPYLHMSVEAETGNRELCISVNWELFRRMMLEAARMAAAAAARRSGTTVLGIALSSQEDMAVITLSENSYLLPDDDTPPVRLNREEPMRFIRRVAAYYHGSVSQGETATGDELTRLSFPLLPLDGQPTGILQLRSRSEYHLRKVASDVLVYLESFSDD